MQCSIFKWGRSRNRGSGYCLAADFNALQKAIAASFICFTWHGSAACPCTDSQSTNMKAPHGPEMFWFQAGVTNASPEKCQGPLLILPLQLSVCYIPALARCCLLKIVLSITFCYKEHCVKHILRLSSAASLLQSLTASGCWWLSSLNTSKKMFSISADEVLSCFLRTLNSASCADPKLHFMSSLFLCIWVVYSLPLLLPTPVCCLINEKE